MPTLTTGTIVVDCTSTGGPETWEANTGADALPLVEKLREYPVLQAALGQMGKKVTITVTKVTD